MDRTAMPEAIARQLFHDHVHLAQRTQTTGQVTSAGALSATVPVCMGHA